MLKKTRKGAYAEYLANYMLSNLGFTAPVPRQEDYGVDLICSLNKDSEHQTLFGDSYAVQIKSSFKNVAYGRQKTKWARNQIDFLFNFKLPFFLGIVDLKDDTLNIYPFSTFRFVKKEYPNCSLITFKVNPDSNGQTTIHKMDSIEPGPHLIGDEGDKCNYIINLQHPILKMNSAGLKDKDTLKMYHLILQQHIRLEAINIAIDGLGWPTFHWPQQYVTNTDPTIYKWIHFDDEPDVSDPKRILDLNSDLIVSLALSFKLHNRMEEYDALCQITQKLEDHNKHPTLGIKHPGLFEAKLGNEPPTKYVVAK